MIQKKGISEVVATVLIILITVAAIVLLIGFLRPFVEDSLNKSTECLDYQSYYSFEEQLDNKRFNCYFTKDGEVYIGSMVNSASTTKQSQVSGFLLVFKNLDSTSTIEVTNGMSVNNNVGGIWRYDQPAATNVLLNSDNEILTYVYHSDRVYGEVEIYPILNSGRVCEKSDSIELRQCNGVSLV